MDLMFSRITAALVRPGAGPSAVVDMCGAGPCRALVCSADGAVTLWDVRGCGTLLVSHTALRVTAVAFDAVDRVAYLGAADGAVLRWGVGTTPKKCGRVEKEPVHALAVARPAVGGPVLVVKTDRGSVTLMDAASGAARSQFSVLGGVRASIGVSYDGNYVGMDGDGRDADKPGSVCVVHVPTGQVGGVGVWAGCLFILLLRSTPFGVCLLLCSATHCGTTTCEDTLRASCLAARSSQYRAALVLSVFCCCVFTACRVAAPSRRLLTPQRCWCGTTTRQKR